jgi:hypothetical protein
MNCEIVALNVLPAGAGKDKAAPSCAFISEEYLPKCEQSTAAVFRLCEAKRIPFRHIVKGGEVKRCVQEVRKEIRRVNFVVSEPDTWPDYAEARNLTSITVSAPA